MNSGVIKEVGEALNQYRYKNSKHGLEIPCIGIASWQFTSGIEQLNHSPILSERSIPIELVRKMRENRCYIHIVNENDLINDAGYVNG